MQMQKLTPRQEKVLSLVIESYIATGEPVGSRAVCEALDNAVSSATIRNDMAELTALGLLEQPHTSAGRVPSQNGYRYYVDYLMNAYELSAQEQEHIRLWLQAFAADPDKLLNKAGAVLAELTNCTVITGAPASDDAVIKKLELLPLTRHTAMLVLLTSSGVLKSTVCKTDSELTLDMVEVFYNIAKAHFNGKPVNAIGTPYLQTLVAALGDKALIMSPLLVSVCELATSASGSEVRLTGQKNILSHRELVENAGELMDFLNRATPVNHLLSSQKHDLNVAIGTENIFKELQNSTTIFSRYSVGGRDSGVVGILGPTRLDYAHMIPGIQYLTSLVGTLLSQSLEDD